MSEMFTKCNGFIVSGDPLVYADSATMTGQGTVNDPFGVKSTDLFVQSPLYTGTSGNSAYIGFNGYNETKLWTTTATAGENIQTFTLSEPYTAFERIKLFYHINDGDAGCAECMSQNGSFDAMTMSNYSPGATGTSIAKGLRYYLVNNNQISAADKCAFFNIGAKTSTTESYSVFYVHEIVGINRKA